MAQPAAGLGAAWELLAVFGAGGLGASLRLGLSSLIDGRGPKLAHSGTLVVNLLGCLAIGVLAAMVPRGPWRTILGAGLLGGFTTYSAFALLAWEQLTLGRWATLSWQLAAHLIGGVVAVGLGLALGGALTGTSGDWTGPTGPR